MLRNLGDKDISGSEGIVVTGVLVFFMLVAATIYLYWRVYFMGKRGIRFQRRE